MTTLLNVIIFSEHNKIKVRIDFIRASLETVMSPTMDCLEHEITRSLLDNYFFDSVDNLKAIFEVSQSSPVRFHFQDHDPIQDGALGHQVDSVIYTIPPEPEYALNLFMVLADYFNKSNAEFRQFTGDSISNQLVASYQGKDDAEQLKYLPLSCDQYLAQAPHQIKSLMINYLVRKVIVLAHIEGYKNLLETLLALTNEPGIFVNHFRSELRYAILHKIPTEQLLNPNLVKAEKDLILEKLRSVLQNGNFDVLKHWQHAMGIIAKKNFFNQFIGQLNHNKQEYHWNSIEWLMLVDAEFYPTADNTMELRLGHSPKYRHLCAIGYENLEQDLCHLFNIAAFVYESKLVSDAKFVFDADTTQKIVGYGLHLNVNYNAPSSSPRNSNVFFVAPVNVPSCHRGRSEVLWKA